MLAIWIDEFQIIFHDWIIFMELAEIIGITILLTIVLRIAVYFYRKLKINSVRKRLVVSTILTVLISSLYYIDYSKKIYQNRFINGELRDKVAKKIESANGLTFGHKADSLTFKQYQEITKINWFPKLPNEASNISYYYTHDGFLPDYTFVLSYNLPKETKVDTLHYKKNDFSKSRQFEIIGSYKRVTYSESLQ